MCPVPLHQYQSQLDRLEVSMDTCSCRTGRQKLARYDGHITPLCAMDYSTGVQCMAHRTVSSGPWDSWRSCVFGSRIWWCRAGHTIDSRLKSPWENVHISGAVTAALNPCSILMLLVLLLEVGPDLCPQGALQSRCGLWSQRSLTPPGYRYWCVLAHEAAILREVFDFFSHTLQFDN